MTDGKNSPDAAENYVKKCFVIMPFIPELHYFYLYIKQYLEQTHKIQIERADERILTIPFSDKINDNIRDSDVIIADCSGQKPNIFYEVGFARALNKKIILITKDAISDIPSDVKHYEFIKYELNNDIEFLQKMDNALKNVFYKRYEDLFEKANKIYRDFKRDIQAQVSITSKETFSSRLNTRDIPLDDEMELKGFLLTNIIDGTIMPPMMKQITNWLDKMKD